MNILAIGCHPDDLEIGCGGTLARYVLEGHTVVMCHVANGNMGHVEIQPVELREIRAAEAQSSAEIIRAKEIISLDIPDLEVKAANLALVEELIKLIRRVQPDVILTHPPEDYMQDHLEVSKLVFDASFSASVPHYAPSQPTSAKVTPIYYMDTLAGVNFLPTTYVDISKTIETKLTALSCHTSQIKWLKEHDGVDFLDFVRTVAKFRGLQCGVAYAEGFRECTTWPRARAERYLP